MRFKSYFIFLGFKHWTFIYTETYLISIGDSPRAHCRLLRITTHSSQAYISITKSSWSPQILQQYRCPEKATMKKREGEEPSNKHKTAACDLFGGFPTKSYSYFYYTHLVLQNILISYFLYCYDFQQTDDQFFWLWGMLFKTWYSGV